MIRPPEAFSNGHRVTADVAVVGAGPLGIVAALELARNGLAVAVIESGGSGFDEHTQRLSTLSSRQDDRYHAPAGLSIRRQVGGTTALWGGRCVPFDPIDFAEREITSDSRWPIAYEEVEPFWSRACDWAVCGRAAFSVSELPELPQRGLVPGFSDGEVMSSELERWSLPTRFGREYRDELARDPNVTVWTGLTCTEIVTDESGRAVVHLAVGTLDGRRGEVHAARYVLAAGGLESTRLLMASDRHHPGGIGNAGGHLGRWYMSHVEGRVANVVFTTPPEETLYEHERDSDGVYVRRRFTFSPGLQRRRQMPNAAIWLVNPPISDPRHGNGILSGVYLTLISPLGRFMLAEAIREAHTKSSEPPKILAHLKNIVFDLSSSLAFAISFSYARFFRRGRKAPGFFVRTPDNRYPLHYHGEHLPHWDSRVELDEERDALGVRRLRTHMHFSADDLTSVRVALNELDRELRAQGVGAIEWLVDDVEADVEAFLGENAGFHQAGTTRMSAHPEDGVVDPQLRVHGVDNLYVAATSVLPTSGQANPTLTGIALTLRLADHLSHQAREAAKREHA